MPTRTVTKNATAAFCLTLANLRLYTPPTLTETPRTPRTPGMDTEKKLPHRKEKRHRHRLVSGLFVIVPLWITYLVVHAIFSAMAVVVEPVLQALPITRVVPEMWRDEAIFFASVLIFLALVYTVGWVTTYVLGRRMVTLGEAIILRIPFVKSIYSAAKQVVDTVSMTSKNTSFKSVILIEFPRPGIRAIGFVTGAISDGTDRTLYKIFIPTAPNPTTGFLEIVEEKDLFWTDLPVEEALKMLVSGGVISPDRIETRTTQAGGPSADDRP